MANFTATDTFSNVEVLETTDQVLGGFPNSPSNKQAQALVNRTEWLKKRIAGMEIVNISLAAMTNLSINNNNIGKFIIVTSDTSNTVRDFNIVLPSGVAVNGNTITILFSDSDNKLLIGTRGGVKYYSGDLVQFIWNGTDWTPNVIHRSINDTAYGTTSSDLGSGKNVITLPSTNRKWYVNNSLTTGRLTNIQLQGSFQPRNGTEISILNISTSVWEITEGESGGNILLGESGVAYNSNTYKSFFIKNGEYLNLVYNNTSANKWELLENDISVKRVNVTGSGGSILPASVYPSLKNWIEKLIERVEIANDQPTGALLFAGLTGTGSEVTISSPFTNAGLLFYFTGTKFNIHGSGKSSMPATINPFPTSYSPSSAGIVIGKVVIKGDGFYAVDTSVTIRPEDYNVDIAISIKYNRGGSISVLRTQTISLLASVYDTFTLTNDDINLYNFKFLENDEIFISIERTGGSALDQDYTIDDRSLTVRAV